MFIDQCLNFFTLAAYIQDNFKKYVGYLIYIFPNVYREMRTTVLSVSLSFDSNTKTNLFVEISFFLNIGTQPSSMGYE